jgi:serine phosphatase RsbU (regulator of sigma subunit)
LESRTQIAAEVQLSMLPNQPPVHQHFDLAGQSIPARDVGGDFYSYYTLGNGHLAIVVGDVTGKGIPAALLMAVTIGMIDGLVPNFTEPVELMTAVSTRLYKHSQRSRLNAACLVTFLEDNRLRVVNAGCIEPIIRRANGQVEWLNISGLPLGLEPGFADGHRHLVERELAPGDTAIFVTDGVVECKNELGRLLGFDGLEAIVAAGPSRSAQEMKTYILEQVNVFRGQREPEDDMTVVVAQLKELPVHAA